MGSRRICRLAGLTWLAVAFCLTACSHPRPSGKTLVFLIESSPNNLDLRQGTDAQSEHIGGLIYDGLARKDEHFQLQPMLATSWDRPDALTWIFHLRPGVHFHDGHPFGSADVAWTIRSVLDGTVPSAKASTLGSIHSIATPDPLTLVLHTARPDNSLLFNLSDGLFGVVEQGSGVGEGRHPNGTGPFRFVSATTDKDVVLERNASYWGGAPSIARVRFSVVPDTITAALEMRKGSADVESNVLTPDTVEALRHVATVRVLSSPGANVMYANFNVSDSTLHNPRVRQAIALAINKPLLISALFHGRAQPAVTLLPATHWAAARPDELPAYACDPRRAAALLDGAGYYANRDGVRLHLELKTSTDETTRLVAEAMQDQLRSAGIDLILRPAEFGTFYADITRGAFQMYMLRWIGVNEDPSIFRYAYASTSQPPHGANRGHYANASLDALLADAARRSGEADRAEDYLAVQQTLARDVPTIPLWYPDSTLVTSLRVGNVQPDPSGNFNFLRQATLP